MTQPVLQLENVTVSYNRIPAVHHVTLELHGGQCVGLLGPNGAGKTTLLKAVGGLLPLETGSMRFRGKSLHGTGSGRLRQTIAYVPQRESIDWDFPVTVRGLVEMGRYPALGPWKPFRKEDRRIVEESIELLGLQEYASRQIRKLSGGQQQKAFLARAWAQQSEIYLLDEPFTGLDAKAKMSFRQTLHELRNSGKILIASHHDLNDVPDFFDHVILLNGELVAAGSTKEAFTPENLETAYSVGVFTGTHKH